MAKLTGPDESFLYTELLRGQLLHDVEKAMIEKVMPDIKKKIKRYAEEAVAHWAIHLRSQQAAGGYEMKTEIEIQFVEEVVKTVYADSPISITTMEKKK